MAGFKQPNPANAILVDVAALNAIVIALAKMNPSTLEDVENGMIWLDVDSGKLVWKRFNGQGWEQITSADVDAASVGGAKPSATATANSIPLRDADGKLAGDITGKAKTAETAEKLSSTLGLEGGGTGATSAQQARQNLGVPPTDHASTTATHGMGTGEKYGHNRLSDAIDSVSDAAGGVAATPLAVKTVADMSAEGIEKALEAASNASAAAGEAQTTANAGVEAAAQAQAVADAAFPASKLTSGTAELEAGVSALPTGSVYLMYE